MTDATRTFELPESVTSPVEIARLSREVEQVAEFMGQAKIRKTKDAKLPSPTKLLSDICEANNLNLLHEHDRHVLLQSLGVVKEQAPLLHFSFAANPSAMFIRKLISWLRLEIHPYTLVTIGLQPGLGAGCMLRTRNNYFDLSLRQHLSGQRDVLIQKLATALQPTEPES